jgi:hypothetical protein
LNHSKSKLQHHRQSFWSDSPRFIDSQPPKSDIAMSEGAPKFEIVQGHEFQAGEKVLVIDPNGFDLWEGVITSIKNGKFAVHYPEYETDDEEMDNTSRILVNTRINRRIFNNQEATRHTVLPPLEDGESEPFSYDSEEPSDAFDESGSDSPADRKTIKKTKSKPSKREKAKPRPYGARVSPRRAK